MNCSHSLRVSDYCKLEFSLPSHITRDSKSGYLVLVCQISPVGHKLYFPSPEKRCRACLSQTGVENYVFVLKVLEPRDVSKIIYKFRLPLSSLLYLCELDFVTLQGLWKQTEIEISEDTLISSSFGGTFFLLCDSAN